MGVALKCPACRTRLRAPETLAGRSIVCPLCATTLKVQEKDDAYQVVAADPPPAPARRTAASGEKPSNSNVVNVVFHHPAPPSGEPSWVAKHALKMALGVVGAVVTAALLAYFGLSERDRKRETKDHNPPQAKVEFKPAEKAAQPQPAKEEKPAHPPASKEEDKIQLLKEEIERIKKSIIDDEERGRKARTARERQKYDQYVRKYKAALVEAEKQLEELQKNPK